MVRRIVWIPAAVLVVIAAAIWAYNKWQPDLRPSRLWEDTYTVEWSEYHPPQADAQDPLSDDKLADKPPLEFAPDLVDRRPLGEQGEWLLNASSAVLSLDVPLVKPDAEAELLRLHASYAAAATAKKSWQPILPSVNLLDGKAKQFDDGLYAALDQAYYQGSEDRLLAHVELVRRLADKAGPKSNAAPFLAAGLELAGMTIEVADAKAKRDWLAHFRGDELASKPIGFYTWNKTLRECFQFLRFFQHEFDQRDLQVPLAIVRVLESDPELLAKYQQAIGFYARLSNPRQSLSVADLMDAPADVKLSRLAGEKRVWRATVALIPSSTSREAVLFEKLFPEGLPANVNLMRELVRRIRSGDVDLQPQPDSGWYDHQVYALETLLLPEKGEERNKLVLSKAYKERMLQAFAAMMTKHRETHVREASDSMGAAERMPPRELEHVEPRLRVEPCPTYYLRTARAYTFLNNFLETAVGEAALENLHGLKQDGQRSQTLRAELHWMRDLFYGLYLVSAEDIGMKPQFAPDEEVDADQCYQTASEWLPRAFDDAELAADTRVAVPIYSDPVKKITRLWVTLGVRLTKLDVNYARPPSLKPANGAAEWQEVTLDKLKGVQYLIPVDEFAEVELAGLRALSREELRTICDREQTKEAIVKALQK